MTSEIRSGRFTVIEDEEAIHTIPTSRFTVIDEEIIDEPPSRFTVIDEEDLTPQHQHQQHSHYETMNQPNDEMNDIPEQPMYAPVDSSSSSIEQTTIGPYMSQTDDAVYTLSDAQTSMQYHHNGNVESIIQSNHGMHMSPSPSDQSSIDSFRSDLQISESIPPIAHRSGRFTVIDEEGEQTVLLTSGHVDSGLHTQSFSPSSELDSIPSMQRTPSVHDPNSYSYGSNQQHQIINQQGYDPEMVGATEHQNYGQQYVDPEHIQHYEQHQNYEQQHTLQNNYSQDFDYQQQQQQQQQGNEQYVQQGNEQYPHHSNDQYGESQDAGHTSPVNSLENDAAAYGPLNLLSMLNCQVYSVMHENEQLKSENNRLMNENDELRSAYHALLQQVQSGANTQQYVQPAETHLQDHNQDHHTMHSEMQYPSPISTQPDEQSSFVTRPSLVVSTSSSKRPPTIQVPSLDSNGSESHDPSHGYAIGTGTATTETPSSSGSRGGSPQQADSFPPSAVHSPVSVASKTDSTLSVISSTSSAQSSDSGKSIVRKPVCKPIPSSSVPSTSPPKKQAPAPVQQAVTKAKPAVAPPAKKKCTLTNPGDFFADFGQQSKLLADLTANPLGASKTGSVRKPSTSCNDAMNALAASLGLSCRSDARSTPVNTVPHMMPDPAIRRVQNSSFDDLKGLALGQSPCPSPTFGVMANLRKNDSSIFL